MKTQIEQLKRGNEDAPIYRKAADIIKSGGLVAFPTETVYGLGANGMDTQASAKIYEAKGRPSDNPLILHIAESEQLNHIVKKVPKQAEKLMEKFWPGPLTIIFEKAQNVPYATTGGLDTVAVRMPAHPAALRLIRESGLPIAAPSANISGRPSPTKAEHVAEDLDGKIDMILDGGMVGIGIESTIVDVTVTPPVILRPGYITARMLSEILGEEVELDRALLEGAGEEISPKAPGMRYRHYAPKAELTIVEGEPDRAAAEILKLAKEKEEQGYLVGVIGTKEYEMVYQGMLCKIVGNRKEEETIAHNLYAVLREFDTLSVDYIYSEGFPEENFGQAIMNRLLKAAGQHIIKV